MDILSRVENYISRYAPSRKKLLSYLDRLRIKDPLDFIANIRYSEDIMLDVWIQTYINQGKSIQEVRIKLYKKEFEKIMIEKYIEKYRESLQDWSHYRSYIEQKIDTYKYRKKSQKEIQSTLQNMYPYFSEQIQSLLSDHDDNESFDFHMEKYTKKYDIDSFEGKQKYRQAMIRRGFAYADIQESIEKDL